MLTACAIYTGKLDRKRLLQGASENSSDSVNSLAASFSGFRIHENRLINMSTITSKTKWVIRDRQKFSELIQEVRMLIDGLQDITKSLSTAARQEGMMRYNIQQIGDRDSEPRIESLPTGLPRCLQCSKHQSRRIDYCDRQNARH
jgi:hypothetical protein